jgi:hypothetical protein
MFPLACLVLVLLSVQFFLIISLNKKISQMRVELDKQTRGLRAIKMIMDMVGDRSKSRHSQKTTV